jgi:hypothetical protein
MSNRDHEQELGLKVGDFVEVRSREEILRTLDEKGTLESMPFMPEMLRFCGRRFRVKKRADKVCDTIAGTGLRRLSNTVMLDDLRCDGTAHDGCQAACLIFWKEAWLKRPDATGPEAAQRGGTPHSTASRRGGPVCTEETLIAATRASAEESSEEELFSCQATELTTATGDVIPIWNPGQYVRDVRSGNVGPIEFVRGFLRSALFPSKFGGHPLLKGKLSRGPAGSLDLQPGEMVRVKSRKEIVATLDTNNKNKGLFFDVHMLRYCGREGRVLGRVNSIIDERTRKMIHIKSDCIILEGFVCMGEYRRLCPRRMYPFWREIWLERVGEPLAAESKT